MSVYGAGSIPAEYLIYKITILKKAVLVILASALTALFFSKAFSLGFFVGGLMSAANFSLLFKYILKMRGLSLGRAKRYIAGKAVLMYFIMAAALFIGAAKGMPAFAGTALGLLVIKFSIFLDGAFAGHVKPA